VPADLALSLADGEGLDLDIGTQDRIISLARPVDIPHFAVDKDERKAIERLETLDEEAR
jgi:hypothetical protein